ncbi:MAG: DUF1993 domain-containing protein [Deltaproteobacteria bacterium]|nr:DUF1993 domain-containing protein [Deltaproteobacteria bacterium]
MSAYSNVLQVTKMLRNLDAWLGKAEEYAEAKGSSADDFVGFRLTPDMRPLSFQVQSACDGAKFMASRLSGTDAPNHPDTETTMAELRQRINAVVDFLGGFSEDQFEGADAREVRMSFLPGKWARGDDYVREMALPNFYFHVTTAYDLLRMAGVSVGKRDFIGSINLHDDPA